MARPKDDAATAQRVADAVQTLLAHGGPQSVTIRAVAREAGCSTGLVMHAFADRSSMLVHARDVQRHAIDALLEQVDADVAAGGSPAAALRATLLLAAPDAEQVVDDRSRLGFVAAALDDATLAEIQVSTNRRFVERVRTLVLLCRPGLVKLDAAAITLSLVGMTEGLGALGACDPSLYTRAAREAAVDRALAAYGLS
ncbi:TetR family transcriptional regulator [Paraoerskovia sediminicola]|uniref:TetR family transcriptional regulator n=1 Tax=Paraoerskovia sediminicola TaxID=1138587 RepID=A0ABN6XEQ8_9CELL|nr:TetR/AcrR family transcriptional regulator [Paraoerskovia sediminicola]BDZ43265.1 TetR family transcriptional regulator [Paraoerskovia sediminicola]